MKLAGSEELLKREFSKMVGWAQRNVNKATTVGSREENRLHNRYKDIGEEQRSYSTTGSVSVAYDDNYISLSSPLFGWPETSYVNASRIVFPNCGQVFLAAQAPKPQSFRHFWHMVIQEQVDRLRNEINLNHLLEKCQSYAVNWLKPIPSRKSNPKKSLYFTLVKNHS